MSTITDLLEMLEARKTVADFSEDINKFKYNASFDELSFSRGKKNYENIIKRLYGLDLPNPIYFKYQSIPLEELKQILEELLIKILGTNHQENIKELSNLIVPTSTKYYFDAIVEEDINDKNIIHTPKAIYINEKLYNIEIVSTAHEYIHALMSKYKGNLFNDHLSNIHYNELLSILIEYIICYELSELLKDSTLIEKHDVIRIKHDKDQATELRDIRALSAEIYRSKHPDAPFYKSYSEYQEHNAYTYILGNIYGNHLFNKYLNDSDGITKLIRSIINGDKSIQDLINYYNLSLRNNDTLSLYEEQINKVLKYPRTK